MPADSFAPTAEAPPGWMPPITDAPQDRIDPQFFAVGQGDSHQPGSHRGGLVQGEALVFEPGRFGIMPVAVDDAEPDQMMALKTAAEALDDAGGLAGVAPASAWSSGGATL